MKPAKKPWSDAALDDLMHNVAKDVAARAKAARERLTNDPVERERVSALLHQNGFELDTNQGLIRLKGHGPLQSVDLMRTAER